MYPTYLKCAVCGMIYDKLNPKPCPSPPEGMDAESRKFMKCTLDLEDRGDEEIDG